MLEKSLWNGNSPYTLVCRNLEALVPAVGSVDNPRKNKALEKFRKAVNCYYDLYNNGLCNRASEFRQVFGIASSYFKNGIRGFDSELYAAVELKMNEIIRAAVIEQGIQ